MDVRADDRLTLRHSGPDEALQMREQLVPIYAETHVHLLDQPWYSPDDWWSRLAEIYSKTRDFDLVTAWTGDHCVGYAFGSPRDDEDLWPQIHAVFPDLMPTGPVYIFREFAVTPAHQRRGHGAAIHDELMRDRPEQAAHLLVRDDNTPALAAYRRWGWVTAGSKRPFPDSPTFAAMALNLRIRSRP
ncbi:GNAT family N-acetyltransferase [Actinoplanes regularis]|uniref:Ribosomal protein S18 acetylase RimI n=1 Tax=Actinoplanes regularis TaxID=52697 RepID=A0A239IWB9_9ACTN|nr:GNAT family N-acetyltransferase [Actinoplanes regularis]GIE91601.1 hypothetical protein Are01nite_80810 [Actinoplanes regularis]SNS97835.1 Ribosomal protein S18 acetylase RimI [Actinoplanes regularis]